MSQVERINFDDVAVDVGAGDEAAYVKRSNKTRKKTMGVPLTEEQRKQKKALMTKYSRGEPLPKKTIKKVVNKKLRSALARQEEKARKASEEAAMAEILQSTQTGFIETEGMECYSHISQMELAEHLDVQNADKIFDLNLDLGPYNSAYSRNGRHLLLGGRKGHIAMLDWENQGLEMEIQVRETIRDVTFLHNHTMMAVAQKDYVYIYDNQGIEIHCLRKHVDVHRLDFLPYHFLLTSIGKSGFLQYQDTSTGMMVAGHRTRLGPVDCMRHNPRNAIVHIGHSNGTVSLWSPNMSQSLVSVLCHKGPVRSLACDPTGNYMVTSGAEGAVNVWDLRTYKKLHEYRTNSPVASIDISATGLVALGFGPFVQTWKSMFGSRLDSPYLVHRLSSNVVRDVSFCPFQDVLGVSHSGGFSSMVVPGAGEANFDAFEANPFETKKQRREAEVHQLLEKLQPDMITLDVGMIGNVDPVSKTVRMAEQAEEKPDEIAIVDTKNRARGRNSARKRWLRKRANIMDQRKMDHLEMEETQKKQKQKQQMEADRVKSGRPVSALQRFE